MKYWVRVTRGLTAEEAVRVYLANTLIPQEDLHAAKLDGKWIIVRTVDDNHIERAGGKDRIFYLSHVKEHHESVRASRLDAILHPLNHVYDTIASEVRI